MSHVRTSANSLIAETLQKYGIDAILPEPTMIAMSCVLLLSNLEPMDDTETRDLILPRAKNEDLNILLNKALEIGAYFKTRVAVLENAQSARAGMEKDEALKTEIKNEVKQGLKDELVGAIKEQVMDEIVGGIAEAALGARPAALEEVSSVKDVGDEVTEEMIIKGTFSEEVSHTGEKQDKRGIREVAQT
jgi:hypothetical protein